LKPQLRSFFSILQLIAGCIVLLFSFAAIVPLPTVNGIILNMIVIEGIPYLLYASFLLLLLPFSKSWKRWLFPVASIAILSIAPVSSFLLLKELPQQIKLSFGKSTPAASFSFLDYLVGNTNSSMPLSIKTKSKEGFDIDFFAYFTPKNTANKPVAILIHGGGFSAGDKTSMHRLGQWLAEKEINAISINYSLAPQSIFPQQCTEVVAAINYCRENYKQNINIDKIYLIGASAGATIALNTVAYLKNQPDSSSIATLNSIKGVVNLYGITDSQLELSSRFKSEYDLNDMISQYTGVPVDHLEQLPEIVCPLLNKGYCVKPVLTIHGTKDNVVPAEHARLLHLILIQKKIPNLYLQLPWATHSFEHPLTGPSGQVTRNAIELFIKD